ncbi:MAG: peptidylprolyl isomerase [Limisphaerales bacterium]
MDTKRRCLLATIVLVAVCSQAGAAPELVNAIVAIVNETVITEKEARQFIEPAIVALERQPGITRQTYSERAMEIYKDGLSQLVERQLTLDDFKSAGYSFPESIIEDFVQERIRERYGDRVKLIKTLEAQNMTYEQFRTDIREQFIVEQMNLKNVSSAVIISPFKIETYYKEHPEEFKLQDQVRLRMIELRKPNGGDPAAVLGRAREIEGILAKGTPFAEMAKTYSEGSQKSEGGDLGWVNRSVLRKEFAAAVANLKPGQRTGVIDQPDACFLLQLEEVKAAQLRPLSEVREEIEKTLLNQERARLQKKYVERLKKKSFVRYF